MPLFCARRPFQNASLPDADAGDGAQARDDGAFHDGGLDFQISLHAAQGSCRQRASMKNWPMIRSATGASAGTRKFRSWTISTYTPLGCVGERPDDVHPLGERLQMGETHLHPLAVDDLLARPRDRDAGACRGHLDDVAHRAALVVMDVAVMRQDARPAGEIGGGLEDALLGRAHRDRGGGVHQRRGKTRGTMADAGPKGKRRRRANGCLGFQARRASVRVRRNTV